LAATSSAELAHFTSPTACCTEVWCMHAPLCSCCCCWYLVCNHTETSPSFKTSTFCYGLNMVVCMCAGSGAFAPSFESEHRVLRLSAKLFNVTPADLPPDVRSALTGWLGGAPAGLEGYIRPGCVLLNLHITLDTRCAVQQYRTVWMRRTVQQCCTVWMRRTVQQYCTVWMRRTVQQYSTVWMRRTVPQYCTVWMQHSDCMENVSTAVIYLHSSAACSCWPGLVVSSSTCTSPWTAGAWGRVELGVVPCSICAGVAHATAHATACVQ
jgi:hypothetical protein